MTNPYEIAYRESIEDPATFWAKAAEDCHWYKKWDKVLDDSNKPFYRWFSGGEVNTCYNALDYHIENGRGDQNAIIYDSPVTDTIKKITYNQLRDEVALFAGALAWATGLPWVTLLLGTSPGGITEMAITAKVLQLGVPVVTAFQVCRLIAVLWIQPVDGYPSSLAGDPVQHAALG